MIMVLAWPIRRFFNTNAERFFNQLVRALEKWQVWKVFIIKLITSELDDFST